MTLHISEVQFRTYFRSTQKTVFENNCFALGIAEIP